MISASAVTPACVMSLRRSNCGPEPVRGSGMRSVFQVLLVRVMQLIERGAEHVLDDDEPRLRRDDDALGTDRAVADVRHLLMQERERVNELPDQAERRVGLDRQQPRFRERQNLRQPHARHVVGDDGQCGAGLADPLDAAHAAVVLRLERRQPADAIAQGEFKGRDRGELLAKREQLERLVGHTDTQTPLAKSILKSDRCR